MDPIIELPSLRIPWKRICTHGACISAGVAGLTWGATAQSYQPTLSANESKINILEGTAEKLEWERDKAKEEITQIKQESSSEIEKVQKDKNKAQEEFNTNQKDLNTRYLAEVEKNKKAGETISKLESKLNRTKHRLSSIIHGYQNKATWKRDILKLIQDL